jgi:D-glycero-alpha-D-manno-heptose-7-phosphate kinase
MIISKTPYRLSLFGGGADYPSWFVSHETKLISAAMANYCYISVKQLPPYFDYVNRVIYSKIESVPTFDEIEHPSVRACLKYLQVPNGISISHDGDLPARSGIGSSSSFTVGLINALQVYLNRYQLSQFDLAMEAINIEQNIIGESVGVQDQIMAAYGGIKLIELSGANIKVRDLKIPDSYVLDLEEHIMLGFSGISRLSEVQAKKQVDSIREGKSTQTLEAMQKLTNEALRVFEHESSSSIRDIGLLLQEQWNYKRTLTDSVANSDINSIYDAAIQAGAYGGKLMGAGGGGFFMFLAPPDAHKRIKDALKQINIWIPFNFDYEGSKIIMR